MADKKFEAVLWGGALLPVVHARVTPRYVDEHRDADMSEEFAKAV